MAVAKAVNGGDTTLTITYTKLTTDIEGAIDLIMIYLEGDTRYKWPYVNDVPKTAAALTAPQKATVLDRFVALALRDAAAQGKHKQQAAANAPVVLGDYDLGA